MIRNRLRGGISTPRDNVNDGGRWSCALQMSHAVVVRAAGCPAVVRHDRAAGRPSCHVVLKRPQQTRFVFPVYDIIVLNLRLKSTSYRPSPTGRSNHRHEAVDSVFRVLVLEVPPVSRRFSKKKKMFYWTEQRRCCIYVIGSYSTVIRNFPQLAITFFVVENCKLYHFQNKSYFLENIFRLQI